MAKVLRAAADGASLRVVFLGGSITQGGHGWIEDWLRRTFPASAVFVQNSGLGGTGSDLGNFRLEPDVIAYDPQLVFVEFCVNDANRPDADVTRDLESLVVRLRRLPRPPAIVILIAGQEKGLDKKRHQLVAERHHLFEIDLDAALHARIDADHLKWGDFMADAVHPNDRGNAFYTEIIAQRLEALRRASPGGPAARVASPGEKPPWTEARLVSLRGAEGWSAEDVPAGWRFRMFPGLIANGRPGAALRFPFRGTAVGLMFPVDPAQGSFFASVDGRTPLQIRQNTHRGYSFRMLADDLSPGEHVLDVVVAAAEPANHVFRADGPVKFGWVAVAGTDAEAASTAPLPGPFSPDALSRLRFIPFPAASLVGVGPFGKVGPKKRYRADIEKVFEPETRDQRPAAAAFEGSPNVARNWTPLPGGDGNIVDLAATAGWRDAGVFYVAARVRSPTSGSGLLRVVITGGRKIWLNGRLLPLPARDAESDQPLILPVELNAGVNDFLWKIGSIGSAATFSASLDGPAGSTVKFESPLD